MKIVTLTRSHPWPN